MQSNPQQPQPSLYEAMCQKFDLLSLLDLLGQQLEAISDIDDYIVNLLDEKRKSLVSLKLHFVEDEFKPLEVAYYKYKVRLDDELNINARTFRQRKIVTFDIRDAVPQDHQWLKLWRVNQISSMPFKDGNPYGEPIGTIVLTKKHGFILQETFDAIQDLIEIFAPALVKATEYFSLTEKREEFRQNQEEQTRFLEFISEVSDLTDLQKIYTLFSNELAHQLPFEMFTYYLLEEGQLVGKNITITEQKYQAQYGDWANFVIGECYHPDNLVNPFAHAFSLNRHLLFDDVQKLLDISKGESVKKWDGLSSQDDNKQLRALLGTERTLLVIPIRQHGKPVGIFALHSLSSVVKVGDADVRLLEHLSTFLGAAISNAKSFAIQQEQTQEIARLNAMLQGQVTELAEQASTDQLTGLYNFRTFKSEFGRRVSASSGNPRQVPLSVVVVDIDHFKHFNDTYGHAAGNIVLAGVAAEVAKLARKGDLACRYGGEEFVVLLDNCDIEGARNFAERMRLAIANAAFNIEGAARSVTVSIGCSAKLPTDTPDSLFERADAALYQAKHNGRNRVEVKA